MASKIILNCLSLRYYKALNPCIFDSKIISEGLYIISFKSTRSLTKYAQKSSKRAIIQHLMRSYFITIFCCYITFQFSIYSLSHSLTISVISYQQSFIFTKRDHLSSPFLFPYHILWKFQSFKFSYSKDLIFLLFKSCSLQIMISFNPLL